MKLAWPRSWGVASLVRDENAKACGCQGGTNLDPGSTALRKSMQQYDGLCAARAQIQDIELEALTSVSSHGASMAGRARMHCGLPSFSVPSYGSRTS